jgi:lysyl-tRNA synthetase class 2
MSWQSSLSWESAKARSAIIKNIRLFFEKRQVIEVETPILSNGTITDVHLDAFTTRYNFLSDSSSEHSSPLYLNTSPEFAMKRLLASGYGCIYQICKAFRHEQYGRYHNPEFTMLEWYRLGYDHFDLMNEVAELLIDILNCPPCTKVSYQKIFIQHTGIDPLNVSKSELIEMIKSKDKMSIWLKDELDNDILLQYIFSEIIEPLIGIDAPCFIYNFPSSQASLAKISKHDPRVADRFECYYEGIELVNGFHELTDGKQQESRFNEDNKKRISKGLPHRPIDTNFINALSYGIPDCAGVAVGIDRLVMLTLKKKHINKVISFAIENA